MEKSKKETTVNLVEELLNNYYEASEATSVPTGDEMTYITFQKNEMVYQQQEREQDKIIDEIPERLREAIILYLNSKDEETWKPLLTRVVKPASSMELDSEIKNIVCKCAEKKITFFDMIEHIDWIIQRREDEEEESRREAYDLWREMNGVLSRHYDYYDREYLYENVGEYIVRFLETFSGWE